MTCDIGVVGLGVMGGNLARNIESRGFTVAGYDLNAAKTQAFAAGEGRRAIGAESAEALAESLVRPRKVLLMVPAGKPVDDVIAHVAPHLSAGDILIDAGNSLLQGHRSAGSRPRDAWPPVPRNWRVRRGRGRAARPRDHAGRLARRVGRRGRHLPGDRGEGRRWRALCRGTSVRAVPGTT